MKQSNQANGERSAVPLLREKAENLLAEKQVRPGEELSDVDMRALVHELQVHQIELEMQNEEVTRAQCATEEMLRKYTDLFDFAPVAYFVWDERGTIHEINFAGAALLGLCRRAAMNMRFGQFVAPEELLKFSEFCQRTLMTDTRQSCEVRLHKGQEVAEVLIESIFASHGSVDSRLCHVIVVDVTELKRTQNELREKEALLSRSQRIAGIGSWSGDIVNNRTTWTDETYRLFGVSPKDFVPSLGGVMSLIHPDDRAALQQRIQTYDKDENPAPLEYRVPLPDGSIRILRDQAELIRDANRRPVKIIGTVQDMTQHRCAEMALRESQQLLQSIVDSCESFIYLADLDGRYLLMNRALEKFCHVARGELIGQKCDVVFSSEIANQYRQNDLEVLRCNRPLIFEEMAVGAGSRDVRDYFTVKYPVRDAQGNIYAIGGIATDVTERQRIDENLREKEHLLSQSQRIGQIGTWSMDLTTHLVSWTAETYRLHGVSPENFIPSSESIIDLVHLDDRERVQKYIRAKLEGGDEARFEFRVPLPNGSVRILNSEGEIFHNIKGKSAHLIGTVQDITEHKEDERKLQQSLTRFEFALHGGDLGAWDWNPKTGEVIYSDFWAQILEYRSDEVEPRTEFFRQHIHPEDLPDVLERLTRHVEGLLPEYQSEYRLRAKSGTWKWILDRGKVVERDELGNAVRVTGVISDVTRRKQSEEALRLSEARLNDAQRIAGVGSWELDLTTMNLICSDEIFRIFEMERTKFDASYKAFLNAVHPEDRDMVDAAYTNSVQTRRPYDIVHRLLMADGRIKFVRERFETAYDSTGRPLRSAGTVQDFTERTMAEVALRESEERFSKTFHQNRVAMVIRRLEDDVIIETNQSFDRMLKRSKMELIGKTVGKIGIYAVPEQRAEVLASANDRKPIQSIEVELIDATGSRFHALKSVEYIALEGEMCALGSFIDITDRKKSEKLRQAIDERLRLVLDNISDGFFILDQDWRYVEINCPGAAMIGRTPEQLIGRRFLDEFPEARGTIWESTYTRVMRIGKDEAVEGFYPLLEKWFEAKVFPFNGGISVFFADITATKQVELETQQLRDSLAHAGRLGTLSEISSGLAHELNQPLAAIHMDAEAALLMSQGLDSDLRGCLQRIGQQSFRAGEMIRRMRSFIRRNPVSRTDEDLNGLIHEVLMLLTDSLRQGEVTVELNLTENLSPITVDGIQIQQVLTNLIRNAIDAVIQNVDLPRVVTIQTEATDREIRIDIADNGCGLDPAVAASLFLPFQTTKSDGLGLGLSICRTLVEAHGGRIEVHANRSRGTTFLFTLPIRS